MAEWWHLHMELLVKHGITKEIFQDIVRKNSITKRLGLEDLLKITNQKEIPFLIFSAGLGDLIQAFLEHEHLLFKNRFFKWFKLFIARI